MYLFSQETLLEQTNRLSLCSTQSSLRLISNCSKIVGQMLEPSFHELNKKKMLSLTGNLYLILYEEYQLLPSNRRLREPYVWLNRLRQSFVHQSVTLINQNRGSKKAERFWGMDATWAFCTAGACVPMCTSVCVCVCVCIVYFCMCVFYCVMCTAVN